MTWTCALELDDARRTIGGSAGALVNAIRAGADLRIGTEFRHNEHIDTDSSSPELVQEFADFAITYLVDDRWAAGIMSLRQPVDLPVGFGPRPSMSFFLYNQNGEQAIARPFLDGQAASGEPGRSPDEPPESMPRYHVIDSWDAGTNAPSHNFVYDFGVFRYYASDTWREVFAHDGQGRPGSGSLAELVEAFRAGRALKVAVTGLCDDLAGEGEETLAHEVFVQTGSAYYYNDLELLMVGTHPLVRVRPAIPMRYTTGGWDFGWLFVRTDGHVVYRRCDPHTLAFEDREHKLAIRWFAR